MNPREDIEIFAIDDNKLMTDLLDTLLRQSGRENFKLFNKSVDLLACLNDRVYICIVDYWLRNDINGLELIKIIVQRNPHCCCIMVSGQKDVDVIIEFMNSSYFARYIDKGGDVAIQLPIILKDVEDHICFIDEFFTNSKKQLDELNKIKTLLKPDEQQLPT